METIRNYIEALFATLPQNADTQRIKADMLSNLEEKYHTLLEEGKDVYKRQSYGGNVKSKSPCL